MDYLGVGSTFRGIYVKGLMDIGRLGWRVKILISSPPSFLAFFLFLAMYNKDIAP